MFGIGWSELLIVLLILLVIFGPGRLPQIGDALGKSIRGFQKAMKGEPKDEESGKGKTTDNGKTN